MSDIFSDKSHLIEKPKYSKKIALRKKMAEKSVIAYQLAKATGVTSVQVSRVLNGHSNGSLEWWNKAAKYLEVELKDIIE